MSVEGREIFLGSLQLRYLSSLRHAIWHGHNLRRSSHVETFTRASHTISTKIIECLFLRFVVSSFSAMSTADMEVVIDFEFFRLRQSEIVVKDLSVASRNMIDSFHFKSPYSMTSHFSHENGLNWDDAQIACHDLYIVVSEAVTLVAQLYWYGVTKCKFLSELLGRPILNLQDFNCPQPTSFSHTRWFSLPCHKFPNVECATKTAHSLYDWLIFHLQTQFYVRCAKYMARRSPKFVSDETPAATQPILVTLPVFDTCNFYI